MSDHAKRFEPGRPPNTDPLSTELAMEPELPSKPKIASVRRRCFPEEFVSDTFSGRHQGVRISNRLPPGHLPRLSGCCRDGMDTVKAHAG